MARGRHLAPKTRTGRSRWTSVGLASALFLAIAFPVAAASWTEKATGNMVAAGQYSGLAIDLAAFEEDGGTYRGQGQYDFNGNAYHIDGTGGGVCIDVAAGTVTIWGPANIQAGSFTNGTIVAGDDAHGLLSLRDNGNGTLSGRAGVRATPAELQPFVDVQCGTSPVFPATGPGELNLKAK